jgi:hypothetical protein
MDRPSAPPDESARLVRDTLERELRLVGEAIALVSSGSARRVVIGGLTLADALRRPAAKLAAEAGVTVKPIWDADEATSAIAVEEPRDDAR